VFGAGAGWPVERRRRTAEVIVRHMWDSVDVEQDPEGFLLEIAEVVAEWPRLDLAPQFTACVVAQAARKPGSTAASAVANGIADRITTNVLDRDPGATP